MAKVKRRRHASVSGAGSFMGGIAEAALKQGTETAVVGIAAAAIPQAAPIIWGAYKSVGLLRTVIKATKEYEELKKTMDSDRAKVVEVTRIAAREGTKAAVGSLDSGIQNQVQGSVSSLLSRPEVVSWMNSNMALGLDEGRRQILRTMAIATFSQFLLGSMRGTRAGLIDKITKGLIK